MLFHTLEVGRHWHWHTPGRAPSDRRVEATSVERVGPAQASAQSAAIGASISHQPRCRGAASPAGAHGARAARAGPRLAAEPVHGNASCLDGCGSSAGWAGRSREIIPVACAGVCAGMYPVMPVARTVSSIGEPERFIPMMPRLTPSWLNGVGGSRRCTAPRA